MCSKDIFSHPNSLFLASSHVPFRQRQTRASRVFCNEQLTKEQLLYNFSAWIIMLYTWSLNKVAQCSQQFGLKVLKYKKTFKKLFKIRHILYENWPNVDLLTMLWTTELFINKIISEQQPRVVYFASYCRSKWLLMMTTGFWSMSPSIGRVT